ncbi:MAG: acetyl-CoA hydrolase/transferase family protein [Myxococcota bacterium]|nr:acetyl-CoA hydrolase/transferase C-terminal domain-containing protein [Myxococcota bacterium]
MNKSVAITRVARANTSDERLLARADEATGSPDRLTSVAEVDAFLAKSADARALTDPKEVTALRGKIDALANAAPLPSAERVLAERTITAEQAAALLQPGERVLVPVGHMAPLTILGALAARARLPGELDAKRPLKLFGTAVLVDPKLYEGEGKIVPEAIFVDNSSRAAIATGRGSFIPSFFHRLPGLIRGGELPIDKVLLRVSPPDAEGYVSIGTSAVLEPVAIEHAKTVIAEMSPSVPRVGGACRVHVSELDHIVRSEAPVITVPAPPASAEEVAIASNIVGLVPDGATLQFGIGGLPNAVAARLAEQGRKGFHIHSEMIADGVMLLAKAGAVAGPIEFSFAGGSAELLQWMDGNPQLVALPIDACNDPVALGKIDKLIAINTALRVDLNGQVNAQMINGSWYSGVGGQVDFMRGASRSPGGAAILALASTRTIKGADGQPQVISSIVPYLGTDDVVTTSMHDLQYVVTEHGVAKLEGKSTLERAEALIAIADPRFQPELRQAFADRLRRVGEASRPKTTRKD